MMGKLAHRGPQTESPLRLTEGILESTEDRPTEGPLTQVHRDHFKIDREPSQAGIGPHRLTESPTRTK